MFSELINNGIAILLLRTVTGILFFFQGYDKLINIKTVNVARTFSEPLSKSRIPDFLLRPAIAFSSLIESVCGVLIFLGLFKYIALYVLAGDMIIVAFVFSSIKPMWDMQFYFPRMILIAILLVSPATADIFSLDYFIPIGIK